MLTIADSSPVWRQPALHQADRDLEMVYPEQRLQK